MSVQPIDDMPICLSLEACAETCTNVKDGDASNVVKVALSVLNIISEFSSHHFSLLSGHFIGCLAMLDLGEAVHTLHQCVNGDIPKRLSQGGGATCGALGDISFAVASFGGVFLFAEELEAFSMIAKGIGYEAVIGSLGATVVVTVLNGAVLSSAAIGHVLFAVKAVFDLCEAVQNAREYSVNLNLIKIKQVLTLITKVTCVALYILILVPGVNAGALAIFALVAFSLAVGTAYYGNYFRREIQQQARDLQGAKEQKQSKFND